ncbi:MAG TPA: sugar ABC transporter ATP-binding protein [Actinomycetota bacterium]|nr:sugar ABC transporter ATP-binding protein [Actinomycetota bacterium]
MALRSVDLAVERGEIHGLVGANGAGKSTLVKILSGVLSPDAGVVEVAGRAVRLRSPAHARASGLAPVFQDPAFAPDLTVAENLRLTGTDSGAFRRRIAELGLDGVELAEPAGSLPLPLLRMLDLARVLAHDPALLLLDEITAALPADYAGRVFAAIRQAREEGRSVLFISHRLLEVQEICDRVTVLRDGRNVDTYPTAGSKEQRIVAAMLGERAALAVTEPRRVAHASRARAGEPALQVRGLADGHRVKGVSLTLARGEVLGITGLEGQGQDELFAILAGDRRAADGEIVANGRKLAARHPYEAIRRGLTLVPSDRWQALLPQRSVRENLAIADYNAPARWGWINGDRERRQVAEAIARLSIDTRAQAQARRLSGGNQQKVAIGRWLVGGFSTLLCFDPTRGIDVGTKHQIYDLFRELAAAGRSVLMFTSELREVPLACDRVLVLYDGRIVAELAAADADEATLLSSAHGLAEALTES